MDVRRILVPTDFSEDAQTAVQWGVYWAQRFGADLDLLHVLAEYEAGWHESGDAFSQLDAVRDAQEEKVEAGLQQATPDPSDTGVATRTAFRRGRSVSGAIRDYASDVDADLIVMGTLGQGRWRDVLLGSVAEQVVRKARRPVLTVRRDVTPEAPTEIERILAPVDFSDYAHEAVRTAKSFAAAAAAQLHLLFVAEERTVPIFNDAGLPSFNTVRMDPEIVSNSQEALRQLSDRVGGPDVEVGTHLAKGTVAKRVVDFAQTHGVDLIVMATRGLTGVDQWIMGSVTQRVVRKAPCPVVTLNARREARKKPE